MGRLPPHREADLTDNFLALLKKKTHKISLKKTHKILGLETHKQFPGAFKKKSQSLSLGLFFTSVRSEG
jgi:hypothetical protein